MGQTLESGGPCTGHEDGGGGGHPTPTGLHTSTQTHKYLLPTDKTDTPHKCAYMSFRWL